MDLKVRLAQQFIAWLAESLFPVRGVSKPVER